MEILESMFDYIQKNFLNLITVFWIVWFAGIGLGIIYYTASRCLQRRTLTGLWRRYEQEKKPGADDPFQVGLDLEDLRDSLSRRDSELREDIERMGLDFEVQAVLENFRSMIQKKLSDLRATQQELAERLRDISQALDDFKDLLNAEQISQTRKALRHGSTGRAVVLLQNARVLVNQQTAAAPGNQLAAARGKQLTARAAFLLGQLAKIDFNYFAATQYYQHAADLQPANLTYLNAAAELSFAFGALHESEHLLEQILKIQERLLGPEHVELAQTLNNLGVLRHTQGRNAEAAAFYWWAIEICEAKLSPQDPEMVNLRQNYAVFLQEVGRCGEADAFSARSAMA